MVRTNYVLIDYESVQPSTLDALRREHVRVMVFVGASQTKISLGVAEAMQKMGLNGSYVRISGHGKNALDFHIAYYIGQLAAADSSTFFHIVSKDTGFDPLVAHLKGQKIFCQRSADVADIPFVRAALASSIDDRIQLIVDRLNKPGATRPRSVKTLNSSIVDAFHGSMTEADVPDLVRELEARGILEVVAGKVSYGAPADARASTRT